MATSSSASRPPRASPRPPCCPPRRVNPAPPSPSSPSASAADLSAGGSSRDPRLARRAPRSTRPRRPAAVSPTTPTPTPTTGPSSVQGRGPTRALRPSPTSRRGTEGGTRDVRDPQTGECIFIFVWAIIMMTSFLFTGPSRSAPTPPAGQGHPRSQPPPSTSRFPPPPRPDHVSTTAPTPMGASTKTR